MSGSGTMTPASTAGVTVSDLKDAVLRKVGDADQDNYTDDELYDYFNEALDFLSRELARLNGSVALQTGTLSYAEHAYSAALPAKFLQLAKDEMGRPRVFNATDDYSQMFQAYNSLAASWENETDDDDGTPNRFIIEANAFKVHPRAEEATEVKVYYFRLEYIEDNDSVIPWNSLFDEAIKQFVVKACHLRLEMVGHTQIDMFDYQILKKAALQTVLARDGFIIEHSQGWSQGRSRGKGFGYSHYARFP